ncbi:MAG: hypothetical protein BMS9Abin07_0659 [Acidimicrobiia bacterium]|nr:MAG: hypothetical protein BMS9Abin07_0659 [Acidimicrobiia bacterium]
MGTLGWPELLIVLVVVLILFGASRLPKLGRSLGDSMKELRKGLEEGEAESSEQAAEETPDA